MLSYQEAIAHVIQFENGRRDLEGLDLLLAMKWGCAQRRVIEDPSASDVCRAMARELIRLEPPNLWTW